MALGAPVALLRPIKKLGQAEGLTGARYGALPFVCCATDTLAVPLTGSAVMTLKTDVEEQDAALTTGAHAIENQSNRCEGPQRIEASRGLQADDPTVL